MHHESIKDYLKGFSEKNKSIKAQEKNFFFFHIIPTVFFSRFAQVCILYIPKVSEIDLPFFASLYVYIYIYNYIYICENIYADHQLLVMLTYRKTYSTHRTNALH